MKPHLKLYVFLAVIICTMGTSHALGSLPQSVINFGMSVIESIKGMAGNVVSLIGGFVPRAFTSQRSTVTSTGSESTTEAPIAQSTSIPVRQRQQPPRQQPQTQQTPAPLLPQPQAQVQQNFQNLGTLRPFQRMPVQQPPPQQQGAQRDVTFTTSSRPSFQAQQPNFNTNFQIPSNISFANVNNAKSQNFDDDNEVALQYQVKRLNGII